MLHFWTDSRMVYVEKRRENTSQIARSACLRSSRSIGHHYVNVLRKNKVAKSGEKNQLFANKNRRCQLKNFKSMDPIRRQRILHRHVIYRKKRLGLQRNLIFNQGIKNIWVLRWWWWCWGGGAGGLRRKQKNVRTSGKILATPLIRTQMID